MKIVLDDGAFKPYKAHPEDAGFDIMSRESQIVPAHGSAIFDTYYNEYGMTVSIREEDRATVAEGA